MKTQTKMFCLLVSILFVFISASYAQQGDGKVYWMVTTEVHMSNLAEFHKFMANELSPLMEKHGYKPVATFQTIVGDIEEVIKIAEFENMGAYHKARVSLLTSDAWEEANKKFGDLVKSTITRFLSAAPYSKLK